MTHYADATSRSNYADDTIGVPALTPEEMEEVMARFRQWCYRVVAKSIAQAEKEERVSHKDIDPRPDEG